MKIFAIVLASIGLVLMLVFALFPAFNDWSFLVNPERASQYGSLMSGIAGPLLTLATFLILYSTLTAQHKSIEDQRRVNADTEKASLKDRFESRFFQLLSFHRDNVRQMRLKIPNSLSVVEGRQVFVEMRRELREIIETVQKVNEQNAKLLAKDQIAEIAYLIFFFGLQPQDKETLILNLKHYEDDIKFSPVVSSILHSVSISRTSQKYRNNYGHQSELGHYYRHLYQLVNFVHNCTFLTENEKYDFVKTVRAQLSTYELVIFYFNTFTRFANPWIENNLVMTYKLIKNIPPGFCLGYDPRVQFPMVYEWQEAANTSA